MPDSPTCPKLPPAYRVGRAGAGWVIYSNGELHDGIDPLPDRGAAISACWDHFYEYVCDDDWCRFLQANGAP